MVITGSDKAFAAGADVAELVEKDIADTLKLFRSGDWDAVSKFGKPIIAAVRGFALGGGFELVLQCDIVIAAENATFGLPEINLGVIPGAGGTQRIASVVGKSLAMEMVLNGRNLSGEEAFAKGIASKLVAPDTLLDEALKLAGQLASRAPVAIRLAKDAVKQATETPLQPGLASERRNFCTLLFGTRDLKEGMQAFLEKRNAE